MGVDNRDWSFTVVERGEGLRAAIVSARDGHAEISAAAPVSYRRGELPNAYVVADGSDVSAAARGSGLDFELVDIPGGDARDAFLRKWATAAKKHKKGLVPLLLLPLAACGGGGGVESLLTSYDGDVAGAKALDATKYMSDFTIFVSDAGAVAAADLTEVASKTTGDVTSASVTSISGTAVEVQAALEGAQLVSLGAVDVVITDAHDLAQLKAINNATSGSITFNDDSVALSGSSADVAAALTGTTYTGNVTLSDAHDLAQLKTINAGTSGGITLHDASVALEGDAVDLLAALDGVAPYSGNVTVTGTATAAQIEALAQLTTGTLTVTLAEGEAVLDLSAATAATVVTVSDDVNVTGSDQVDKLIVTEGSNDDVDVVADLGKGADEVRVEDGAILAAKGDSIQITDGGNPGDTDKLTVSGTNVFDANSSWTDIEVLEIESSITFTAKQINAVGGNIKVADAVKDDLGEHKVTIAPVTEADLQPGETLAEANAVNLKTLEGVTAIAVGSGVAAELDKTAAENLAATQSKYEAAAVTVDTGIEVDSGAGAGEIVVSPEAKAALEGSVTVKVGGVEAAEIPYSVSGTLAELGAMSGDYISGARKVFVENAGTLDELVGVGSPLAAAAAVVYAGGIKDDAANLLSGGDASAQLTTALGKHAAANITVTSTDVLTSAQVGTLQTAMGAYSSLTATVGGLASELATLREDVKGYASLTISVTDAEAAPVSASDLKAIGLATSGTATVANKVAISGNIADVTAALVTPASKVVLGTADTPVTVADAVTAADGAAIATVANANASFTTGVVDALGNLSSGGTINSNLSALAGDDTDVAIAINDADNFSAAAADLKVVGGATTGTVTVTNKADISGSVADVTAALITDSSKVVLSKASTATVADAVTAKQGGDIAGLANVTATFTTGVNDSLTNLLASAEADIDKVVADHASVAIVINDTAGHTPTAANLSTIGGKTSGTVTVENAAAISGSVTEVTAALVTDLTKVVLGADSTVTVSGAVTAKQGADIASVAKATATFSNGVADALDKLAASGAITTDLTGLLGDDATVTITINDAGTLTAAAADLKAIGGATSGAVNVANAAAISGTAADVTAALVTAETKVALDTASTVSVSDAVSASAGAAIAGLANVTATFTTGVNDSLTNLLASAEADIDKVVADHASVAIVINDTAGHTPTAANLSTIGGKTSGTVTVENAAAISGSVTEVTAALVTDLTKVVLGADSTVTVSGAVTAKQGADIASVAKATATFSNGVADALDKLAASGAITTDLTGLLGDDATVTITINDAGTLTAAAADLKAIGGATSGAVNVANAAAISGTAADVTAALVTAETKVALDTASTVSVSDAVSASAGAAIAGVANATATYAGGVADAMASLYDTGSDVTTNLGKILTESGAALAVTVNDASGSIKAADLSGLQGHAKVSGVTVSGAVTISGTESEITDALVTKSVGATLATAVVSDTIGVDVAAANLSAINAKVASVTVTNAIDVNGDIAAVKVLQALAGVTLPADYSVNLTDTGAVAVGDLSAVAGKTTGAVVLSGAISVSGTAAQLEASFVSPASKVVAPLATITVTGDDSLSLASLKAINEATSGSITLNNATKQANFSGAAADLVAAFDQVSGLSGAVSISDAPDLAALKSINLATSGSISLSGAATSLSGTASDLKAALSGIQNFSGSLSVTDQNLLGVSGVNTVNEINSLTTGKVTASVTASPAQLKGLTTNTSDDISISLNDVVTLSEYNEIGTKTGLAFSYSGATTAQVNEDAPLTLTLDDFSFSGANKAAITDVIIATLPRGSLLLDGVQVTKSQSIAEADISAGKLVYQSLPNDDGDADFKFLVKENGVLTADEVTVTLDVVAVDDDPVNTIATPFQMDENQTASVSGLAVADVDDASVTVTLGVDSGTLNIKTDVSGGVKASAVSGNGTNSVQISGLKTSVNATLSDASGVQFTPSGVSTVTLTMTSQAADGGGVDTDTMTINVRDVDEPPSVAVSDPNALSIAQGDALSVTLNVTDDSGVNPTAAVVSKPAWVTFDASSYTLTAPDTAVTNAEVGTHTVTLEFTDNAATPNTVTETITISVSDVNDAPSVKSAKPANYDVATQHLPYSLDLNTLFEDIDEGAAAPVITVGTTPAGSVFNAATGVLTWTPTLESSVGAGSGNNVTVIATDAVDATLQTPFSYTITVGNANDKPVATDVMHVGASSVIDEATWDQSTPISGVFTSLNMVTDQDADDTVSNLILSIDGTAAGRTATKVGTYGTLTIDLDADTYSYAPDVAAVEALASADKPTDAFAITFTDDGGLSADTKNMTFKLFGANNAPSVTAPSFEKLDNSAQNSVVGTLTGTDDVDASRLVFSLTSNSATDNSSFVIVNDNELKLAPGVTTDAETKPKYTVEVLATDTEGGVSNALSFEVSVDTTDKAPKIVTVTADVSDKDLAIGDVVNFTATASEAVQSNSGTATFTMTLSNLATVTMTRSASDSTVFTGSYTVAEGDATSADLNVASYVAGNVVDGSGQALSTTDGAFALTNLTVDATRPEATISTTGHSYDSTTSTLTLAGAKLNTLGVADGGSVKDILDFTKLTWNAVSTASTVTRTLAKSDVASATVSTTNNEITITFDTGTGVGSTALHALSGFGGTGTKVDTLTVSDGFLRDQVLNTAAQTTSTVDVAMSDTTAPTIASVTASTVGNAELVGVGDVVTFTATMSDANDIKIGTSFTITLDNNETVELKRSSTDAGDTMVGTYTVGDGDTDSAGLSITALAATNTASDVSGNVLQSGTPPTLTIQHGTKIAVKGSLSEATISTTGHSYDSTTSTLTLAGAKLNTLGVADGGSVKDILDFTKLTWNAVSTASTVTRTLAKSDVASATVSTTNNEITITFDTGTGVGSTALHALSGFGGTGTKVDTLTVSDGFLRDQVLNTAAQTTSTVDVAMSDTTAPTIASVTASTVGNAELVGVGDVVTFTATMSDANDIKIGTSFTITLDNNETVELKRSSTDAGDTMVGTYTVGDGDTDSAGLSITALAATNTASDVSGNVLQSGTAPTLTIQHGTKIEVDASPPTAKLSEVGHTLNTQTNTLTLAASNLGTLGVSEGGSVKEILDWTKLKWNAVGDTTNTVTLAAEDVSSAVVDLANGEIDVVLAEGVGIGATELYALPGFGGVGGKIDTLQISEGFLNDVAGNASSEEAALSTVDVAMVDTTAPVVSSVVASTVGDAAVVGAGDTVTFTATMLDDNDIKIGSKFTLTLNNGALVTLERTSSTAVDTMVGDYVVQAGDDVAGLSIATYIVPTTNAAKDLSGNKLASGASLQLTNDMAIEVDTVDPEVLFAFFSAASKLTVVFSEDLPDASQSALEAAIVNLTGVTGVDAGSRTPLSSHFDTDGSFAFNAASDITGLNVTIEDIYGNSTLVTAIDLV